MSGIFSEQESVHASFNLLGRKSFMAKICSCFSKLFKVEKRQESIHVFKMFKVETVHDQNPFMFF